MPVGDRRLAVLALVATMAIWGSSFVVTKLVLDEAGPFAVTALRFGLGLLVLLPFAYRRGFRLRLVLEPVFLLFGLTGVALVYGLQTMALVFTSAANTALISAGVPVVAAVLARIFLKEAIPPARLLGIGLSVLGVGLVSGATPPGADPSGTVLLGNALMVGAVVAYGAYAVQGRALRSGEGRPAVVATAASFAAGLLFLLPLAAGEVLLLGAPDRGAQGWIVLAYLGAVASALADIPVDLRPAARARERGGALHQPGARGGPRLRPAGGGARRRGATRRRGAGRRRGAARGRRPPERSRVAETRVGGRIEPRARGRGLLALYTRPP